MLLFGGWSCSVASVLLYYRFFSVRKYKESFLFLKKKKVEKGMTFYIKNLPYTLRSSGWGDTEGHWVYFSHKLSLTFESLFRKHLFIQYKEKKKKKSVSSD